MQLKDLHNDVEQRLKQKLNIQSSLTIMNVPKQKLLDRGDLVMLLDEKLNVVSTEWLRDGYYHVQITDPMEVEIIQEVMKHVDIRVFETETFDSKMDVDRVIEYMSLSARTKKKIKKFTTNTEKIFEERYTKYGRKADKQTWLQAIIKQNGIFTEWCKDKGYPKATTEAIYEAFKEAEETNDWSLKRRAAMAKCFNKIKLKRDSK